MTNRTGRYFQVGTAKFLAERNDSGDWLDVYGIRYDIFELTYTGGTPSLTTGTALTDTAGEALMGAAYSGKDAEFETRTFVQAVNDKIRASYSPS